MLEHAHKLTEEYAMLLSGQTVLCAVSGGADSMCLLHWLSSYGAAKGISLCAAHYHHHLRDEESDRDAHFVSHWCEMHHIPFYLGGGDVAAEAKRLGKGVEETGRALRYAFLEKIRLAVGAQTIATAHNADDNGETLLLHLVRGTGLQGLGGIPPRRAALIRPLLTTTRREIEAYLIAQEIPHVEDSSNTDRTYARNRIRHDIMPLLSALNPRLTEGLSNAARTLRADNDFLNAQALRLMGPVIETDAGLRLDAACLARQPDPIAVRMARQLLLRMGEQNGTAAHLTAIVSLARSSHPSAVVHLLGGLQVQRQYGDLLLCKVCAPARLLEKHLNKCEEQIWEGVHWRMLCRPALCAQQPKESGHFFLSLERLEGELWVRSRQQGDEIRLPLRGRKRLKKLFVDEKLPRTLRELVPVLADVNGPVAVAGFGPSMPHLAQDGEEALEVFILPIERER